MDDVCQVDEVKIEDVGRTLFGKTTVAGTFGNAGPLAFISLQTLLERWLVEMIAPRSRSLE